MAVARRRRTRTLRATKDQVATQLRSIHASLNTLVGTDILAVGKSDDGTFWEAQISTGFTAFNGIQQKLDTYVEFDSEWLVDNLIAAVDNTVTAGQVLEVLISPTDASRIEVILLKVKL